MSARGGFIRGGLLLAMVVFLPGPAYAIVGEETALLTKIWIDQAAEVTTLKKGLETARQTADNMAQMRALYNTTVYVAEEFKHLDLKLVLDEGFKQSEAGKDVLATSKSLSNAQRSDYYTWDSVGAVRNALHQIYFGTPIAPSPLSPEYYRRRMEESQVTDVLKKFTAWADPKSPDGVIEEATRKRMQLIMDRCTNPVNNAQATFSGAQCSGAALYWLARMQDAIMQNNATGAYMLAETARGNIREEEVKKDDFRGLAMAVEVPMFPLYYKVSADGKTILPVDMRTYRRGDLYMDQFYREQRLRQATEGYGIWGSKKP